MSDSNVCPRCNDAPESIMHDCDDLAKGHWAKFVSIGLSNWITLNLWGIHQYYCWLRQGPPFLGWQCIIFGDKKIVWFSPMILAFFSTCCTILKPILLLSPLFLLWIMLLIRALFRCLEPPLLMGHTRSIWMHGSYYFNSNQAACAGLIHDSLGNHIYGHVPPESRLMQCDFG